MFQIFPVSFIYYLILPSWMLREWLCSVLTNTKLWWSYYPNSVIKIIHRRMIYENIITIYLSKRSLHFLVMVQHALFQWTTCDLSCWQVYFQWFNKLFTIYVTIWVQDISQNCPNFLKLKWLKQTIITKIENASKYFLH